MALCSLKRLDVACNVVDVSDEEAEEMSLTENVQRASLTAADKVRTYSKLLDLNGGDINVLSRKLSINAETLKKYLRIAKLPSETVDRLDGKGDCKLTLDTAVALSRMPPHRMNAAADAVTRLPTNESRAQAINQMLKNPLKDMARVVDDVSIELLQKTRLVPDCPWIYSRNHEIVSIPEKHFSAIWKILESV